MYKVHLSLISLKNLFLLVRLFLGLFWEPRQLKNMAKVGGVNNNNCKITICSAFNPSISIIYLLYLPSFPLTHPVVSIYIVSLFVMVLVPSIIFYSYFMHFIFNNYDCFRFLTNSDESTVRLEKADESTVRLEKASSTNKSGVCSWLPGLSPQRKSLDYLIVTTLKNCVRIYRTTGRSRTLLNLRAVEVLE